MIDFWISAGDRSCMVMELLSGRTLAAELLERRRLPLTEALTFMHQLLSALSAAHELGINHRDISACNRRCHFGRRWFSRNHYY